MSTQEQPGQPAGRWYPPEEALEHAKPLPAVEDMVIDDLTDDEWQAFIDAIRDT
jgi:hypothetical protein